MKKESNTGWLVLGGIALCLFLIGQQSKNGNSNSSDNTTDSSKAPDTAASTEIILSTGKP